MNTHCKELYRKFLEKGKMKGILNEIYRILSNPNDIFEIRAEFEKVKEWYRKITGREIRINLDNAHVYIAIFSRLSRILKDPKKKESIQKLLKYYRDRYYNFIRPIRNSYYKEVFPHLKDLKRLAETFKSEYPYPIPPEINDAIQESWDLLIKLLNTEFSRRLYSVFKMLKESYDLSGLFITVMMKETYHTPEPSPRELEGTIMYTAHAEYVLQDSVTDTWYWIYHQLVEESENEFIYHFGVEVVGWSIIDCFISHNPDTKCPIFIQLFDHDYHFERITTKKKIELHWRYVEWPREKLLEEVKKYIEFHYVSR